MPSSVTVCNAALAALGDNPIQSLTAGTKSAILCNSLYEQTRDRLLRRYAPNCARKTVLLAPTATKPDFDWGYQYLVPPDSVRVLQVGRRGIRESYEIVGRTILANVSTLPIVYVWRNADEQTWDSQFLDLMTCAMGKVLAYPITKSPPMRDAMAQEFERMRKEMGAVNGQEQEPDDLPESTIQSARF